MVATRRTPVAPSQPTPVSRNNSTQAVSKTRKQAAPLSNVSQKQVTPSSQEVATTSGKQKGKRKKSKKNKGALKKLVELLTQIFFFFVVIYTIRVCPNDESLETPLCRALFYYRKNFLEPLVLPPLLAAYHHPSVQPYVQRVQPHIATAVRVTTPIISRTNKEINEKVIPQWNKRVVPQWNARIVPQWNKRVVPLWHQHATPQLRRLDPAKLYYHNQMARIQRTYDHQWAPHVAVVSKHAQEAATAAKPYAILAAHKSHEAYQTSRPHIVRFLAWLKVQLDHGLSIAGHYRRIYVDPHLLQIWDKVTELSTGTTTSTTTSNLTGAAAADGTTVPSPEKLDVEPEVEPQVAFEAPEVPSSLLVGADATAIETTASETPLDTPTPSSSQVAEVIPTPEVGEEDLVIDTIPEVVDEPIIPAEPAAVSASSVMVESLHNVPTSSQVYETASAVPSAVVAASDPEIPAEASSQEETEEQEDDDYLASFMAELGLGPEPAASPSDDANAGASTPEVMEETEEEKAAREAAKKAATAAKRASIEAKHSSWETKLNDAIKAYTADAPTTLTSLREANSKKIVADQKVNDMVDELEKAGGKYLKGIETYLAELQKGSKRSKGNVDKRKVWDTVSTKVEDKFNEELKTLRGSVHEMYVGFVNEEIELLRGWAAEVKAIAEKGQTAVGLDYVWLDDVTARDWTRYHALLKSSEAFARDLQAIQEGSHASSPSTNALVDILDDLDADVQDIALGFESALRRLRRTGDKELAATESKKKDLKSPVAPIEDSEKPQSPPIPEAEEPVVSILPVEGEEEPVYLDDLPGVAFIGKDKEDVIEKLKNVKVESVIDLKGQAEESEAPAEVRHLGEL